MYQDTYLPQHVFHPMKIYPHPFTPWTLHPTLPRTFTHKDNCHFIYPPPLVPFTPWTFTLLELSPLGLYIHAIYLLNVLEGECLGGVKVREFMLSGWMFIEPVCMLFTLAPWASCNCDSPTTTLMLISVHAYLLQGEHYSAFNTTLIHRPRMLNLCVYLYFKTTNWLRCKVLSVLCVPKTQIQNSICFLYWEKRTIPPKLPMA